MGLTYDQAVAVLEQSRHSRHQPGLQRTYALLEALDHPDRGLRGVLVAGTNGKGSTCAALDSICRAAGLRSVLLTKPHLLRWNERITVHGKPLSDEDFADLVGRAVEAAGRMNQAQEEATTFELLTVVGVLAARQAESDVVICEVGLGGRLDSTNVLDLGTAVITTIARDHTALLGNTVAAIAAEKAAIIKPGNHVVTSALGEALPVIRRAAREAGATLAELERGRSHSGRNRGRAGVQVTVLSQAVGELTVDSPLCGDHQINNVATAVVAAQYLSKEFPSITFGAIHAGCATVNWPGRLQWIEGHPSWLLDGAHNARAMQALAVAVPRLVENRRVTAVFGVMADKDVTEMLETLRGITASVVFTAPPGERAVSPEDLLRLWGQSAATDPEVGPAIERAAAEYGPDGVVLICGSLALVGAALATRES